MCSCFDVWCSFGVAGLEWYPCSRLNGYQGLCGSILKLTSDICLFLPCGYFLQVYPLISLLPPYVLHAPLISFSFLCSFDVTLHKKTNNESHMWWPREPRDQISPPHWKPRKPLPVWFMNRTAGWSCDTAWWKCANIVRPNAGRQVLTCRMIVALVMLKVPTVLL